MRQVDYYEVLEVRRTDDQITIKRAYRRLARAYHPDQNPNNPAAEEHFKRVVEAWDVLGDEARRKHYDRWGHNTPFDPSFSPIVADPMDLLKTAAKTARNRLLRRQGKDLSIRVTLTLKEALRGGTRVFEIPRSSPEGTIHRRRFEVKIPPGVGQGRVLRWKGYGAPGTYGGAYGNLLVHIAIEPHPIFRFSREKLFVDVFLNPDEARHGCALEIPTPWGLRTCHIPPNSDGRTIIEVARVGGLNDKGLRDPLWVQVRVAPHSTDPKDRREFDAARARLDAYVRDLGAEQSS